MMSHHEVDGGGKSSVGLHQGASRSPGAEHQAHIPWNRHSYVWVMPGDQGLAIKELRRRHD